MYVIYLDDGTEINANLNANTWESDEALDEDIFEGNTNEVSYETPDGVTVELGECVFNAIGFLDEKWCFSLNPITDEQKAAKAIEQNTANIDYLSAMTGIDL